MIQNRFHRYWTLAVLLSTVFCLIAINSTRGRAQATLGAREIALGQATTALSGSKWSVFENPAIVDDQKARVSFFVFQYYGLANLTDIASTVSYPTGFGVIGGGAHRYGDDIYNETRIRLSYKNSYERFHYGVALNYSHIAMGGGYGSVGAVGIDVGIAALITDELWIGAKATNINQPKYGSINDIDEDLPRNLSIGFSYHLSGVALLTTDVVKDVNFPIAYRAGIEIKVIDHLKARVGITTAPRTFSGGFGYNTNRWGVNVVVQRHEVKALGFSPGIDFNLSW